jgi:hypothetical protein
MVKKIKKTAKEDLPKKKTSRKHTRFAPDAGAIARIDFTEESLAFRPTVVGLVIEESYNGCGLVIVNDGNIQRKLQVKDRVQVQVGKLDPCFAEVRWRAELDAKVIRLGLMYLG